MTEESMLANEIGLGTGPGEGALTIRPTPEYEVLGLLGAEREYMVEDEGDAYSLRRL